MRGRRSLLKPGGKMKRLSTILLLVVIANSFYAQNLIDGAESIAYHPATDAYFVSSLNNNKLIRIDSQNNQTVFAENIIAFGNCIKGDILFLSSGSYINGINVNTGQIDFQVRVNGAIQFDGMTYDLDNNLYVVESATDKIVKIDITTGEYSFFIEEGLENNIQDLIYDPFTNRILTCAYGSETYITSINPETGENTKLIRTVGRFDGITIDSNGFVYLGTHANGGEVIMYSNDFLIGPILIQDGIQEPAGLDFNIENNTIAVPSFSGDTVYFLPLPNNFFYPAFTESVVSGHAPLKINFFDRTRASVEPTSWEWDFSDDGVIDSREQNPNYSFSEPGVYSVSLIVDNINGKIVTKSDLVHVFDGESSVLLNDPKAHIIIQPTDVLNLTQNFCIEVFINLNKYPSTIVGSTIFDKSAIRLYATGNAFGNKSDSTIAATLKLDNGYSLTVTAPSGLLEIDKWTHVAFCFDGDENIAKFYINGSQYDAIPTGSTLIEGSLQSNDSSKIYLGNDSQLRTSLPGKIDEIRVWNITRNTSEIVSTLNHSLHGNEDSLIGFWNVNEGSGNVVYDYSSYSNNGILTLCVYRQGVDFASITSVIEGEQSDKLNVDFELSQNYPNPFNPTTQIKYRLHKQANVQLSVYNILGEKIVELVDRKLNPGLYTAEWNGEDKSNHRVSSGVYFYELKVDHLSVVKKMTILK